LKLTEKLSDFDGYSFVVPSLDHFAEVIPDTNTLLSFLSILFANNISFDSINDSLSSTQQTQLFIIRMVTALETAKASTKSLRIRNARVEAKLAGEHVGAKKLRNDEKIRQLRSQGLSIRAIAHELGTSTSPVVAALKI
jgi:DNA invertase Pin-like site-specific DNA recombinase